MVRHALDADDWIDDRPENDGVHGAAAQILLNQGDLKGAALLIDVTRVEFGWEPGGFDNPTPRYARLFVEAWQVGRFDNDVRLRIASALSIADHTTEDTIDYLIICPVEAPPGWREKLQEQLVSGPRNQAAIAPLPKQFPRADGMAFRDSAELTVYQALKAAQETRPQDDTFTIVPNCAARVTHRTWEPDFLIIFRGRCAAIEVDGASHRRKYLGDKSRDDVLQDSGVAFVRRIDANDVKPDQLPKFISRLLERLANPR